MKWHRLIVVFALLALIFIFGVQQLNSGLAAPLPWQDHQPAPLASEQVSPVFPVTAPASSPAGSKSVPPASLLAPQTETCGGVYPATADAVVAASEPDVNYGSGALWAHQSLDPDNQERILLKFDPYGAVPQGGTVQRAVLELTIYSDPWALTNTLQVYSQQNADWVETEVTWNSQPTTTIDFGPVSYGITQTTTYSDVLTIDITTWAILWANGAIANTGLTIAPAGSSAFSASFYGREGSPAGVWPRLVIYCQPERTVVPLDSAPGDARQMLGLERLRSNSTVTPTLRIEDGLLRSGEFQIAIPSSISTTGMARALWFTQTYSDALRLDPVLDELQLMRRSQDDQNIFFRQVHDHVPVYPSEIGVHLAGRRVIGVSEGIIPGIRLDQTPQLSAEQAEKLALALAGSGVEVIGDTQLTYFNLGLTGGEDKTTYLAWRVNRSNNNPAFIDANSGKLLLDLAQSDGGFDLDLDTANGAGPAEGSCMYWWWTTDNDDWCDEDGCKSDADAEGRAAFNNIRTTWVWWRNTFGLNSFDNDGSEVEMYVHVGHFWRNASWSRGCARFLQFGDYYPTSLEIVAHEFTHAITADQADLIYNNEPGAICEGFSDVFGHFVGGQNDWVFGEGLPYTDTSRSMSSPGIDRYSKYWYTTEDHGGVHENNGIMNKAAYLITHGDQFNGYDTNPGIGTPKAETLFYKMIDILPKWAQFSDLRNAAVLVINQMAEYAPYGVTTHDICVVLRSFAAVEIGNGDFDCNGVEDSLGKDTDWDGIPDLTDNCDPVANPSQTDTDKDGYGDACDADSDGDMFLDNHAGWGFCTGGNTVNCNDNCQFVSQTNQNDWNFDGVGDACDDSDIPNGDGVLDDADNCLTVFNPDQAFHDQDGLGDACDPDNDDDFVLDDGSGNGIEFDHPCMLGNRLNCDDNCPITPNAYQTDPDGDGIGQVCDKCPLINNAYDNTDPDGDGLANPCDPDDDDDGVLDNGDQMGIEGDHPCTAGNAQNCDDNCRLIQNPDQLDYNKNGIGAWCEAGDHPKFGALVEDDAHSFTWVPGRAATIPLPGEGDNLDWGQGLLGQGYRETVNMQTNVDVFAQVVDSEGTVVGRTSRHAANMRDLTIRFEPEAFAFQGGIENRLFGSHAPTMDILPIAPSAIRYYLQLYPAETVFYTQTYTFTVQVTGGVPVMLYLPLVRK